jgi:hypothetical protein
MSWYFAISGLILMRALMGPAQAAELPVYPDSDTEKACASAGESPECAAKTFLLCSEKSIAVCKVAGLNVQADGMQHKSDGTVEGDVWTKPWAMTWNDILHVTHPTYRVWQIEGLRELPPARLKGFPGSRRGLAGSHEMTIKMVNAAGKEERQSLFLSQKKGVWTTTGFARWNADDKPLVICDKIKLGSLACRYAVPRLITNLRAAIGLAVNHAGRAMGNDDDRRGVS